MAALYSQVKFVDIETDTLLTCKSNIPWTEPSVFPLTVVFVNSIVDCHLYDIGYGCDVGYRNCLAKC